MTGKVFVDSNILIYAHDLDAGVKNQRAAARLLALWDSGLGCLSTQVLQEFYVNVTRRIPRPLSGTTTREPVHNYAPWVKSQIGPATVVRAGEISDAWRLSFWDSQIVAAAEEVGAAELLTEDLSHRPDCRGHSNPQSVLGRMRVLGHSGKKDRLPGSYF